MQPMTEAQVGERIQAEQIAVLFSHLPFVLAANAMVGTAVAIGVWGYVSPGVLGGWWAAMMVMIAARGMFVVLYRRDRERFSDRAWQRVSVLGSLAGGLLWGVIGLLQFQVGSLELKYLVIFALMGMGAGAISSLTAYLPAMYAYLPVSILPMSVVQLFQSDRIDTVIGIMGVLYTAFLMFFGRNINGSLRETLRLRYENLDLLQELSEQKEAAERADVAKSKFLAAASHDLRQPLHALGLFVDALGQRQNEFERESIVERIKAAVDSINGLLSALLDISKLDAGVVTVERRSIHLPLLLEELEIEFRPQAQAKGLRFVLQRCCDCHVDTDSVLLMRILRNLLSNAVRYTECGQVMLRADRTGDVVNIEVADTGAGIPVEEQEHVFEEFHQLPGSAPRRDQGLGLGLAIVRRLTRLLGHHVAVESRVGVGSRFVVTLPASASTPAQIEGGGSRVKSTDFFGHKVLVVDDEPDILEAMEHLLAPWGMEVITAGSLPTAVSLAVEQSPDLIISDYQLKEGEQGLAVIDAIRAEMDIAVPALVVTGDTAPGVLQHVRAHGTLLLHKPVQPAQLRLAISRVLRQARALTALP